MNASNFASMNNVPPVALRSYIYRGHQAHPEKSDDVLADEFVNKYKKNNMIFFYYGINLRDLPILYGIIVDESKVKKIYLAEYKERDDISFEDAINEIIDSIIGIKNKNMILKMKASQVNKDGE